MPRARNTRPDLAVAADRPASRGYLGPVLLAVDVGNTQTHVGAFRGDDLVESWRFQTRAGMTGDELAGRISGFMELSGLDLRDSTSLVVSSVVPPLGTQYENLTERYLTNARCLLVGPGIKTGMPIRIDNPLEVGADRLVNAVAAYKRFAAPCVVVDFGTGINFDAVSAEGEYLGGAIAPGVEISLSALTQRGARIPRIELAEPESAIGKSTKTAIQSGVVYGFAGLIDGIARRIAEELGGEVPFIATGGLASAIAPFCEEIDEIDEQLTLTGLRLINELND
jgi:type III pantothenate kinase